MISAVDLKQEVKIYHPVRSGSVKGDDRSGVSSGSNSALVAPNYVQTSTPNENGSVTHVVQYGETLIDIAQAYGITI